MANFDADLRDVLSREAGRVAPDRGRRAAVVARVGRRRVARAWGSGVAATVVAVAAASGAGALVSTGDRGAGQRAAAHASPSDGSTPETYPVLATGTHDGRSWILHIRDLADGDDGAPDAPEVVFEIDRPGYSGSFETHSSWDVVDASFQDRLGASGEYVMGMVDDDAASVTVVVGEGNEIDAPIFGYDETRYFLAFLPHGAHGLVIARSESGEVLGSERLPGTSGPGPVDVECPSDHDRGDEVGDERFPVLGRGTFDGRKWVVSLIEDPDAAHPEDLESENPELAFEIEGPWPNGGTMETYSRWEGVSPPFQDSLRGGYAFALGMAAAEAATVTVEPDAGEPVEAQLFDARDVPRPGSQVYLAFVPRDTTGDVVAYDATGAEIGRVPLEPVFDPPGPCERPD